MSKECRADTCLGYCVRDAANVFKPGGKSCAKHHFWATTYIDIEIVSEGERATGP